MSDQPQEQQQQPVVIPLEIVINGPRYIVGDAKDGTTDKFLILISPIGIQFTLRMTKEGAEQMGKSLIGSQIAVPKTSFIPPLDPRGNGRRN